MDLSITPPRTFSEIHIGNTCHVQTAANRLYFAAYQDKIHVFQPRKAPNVLPPPCLILTPKKSKLARVIGGIVDTGFGHQMNSIMVGNLGNLEVLFFAFDDGDVGAYYTHSIARCIRTNSCHSPGTGSHRMAGPKEFFHDNVGLSAWGLAIHQQSRLLAVSSNKHEVTVFAFAMSKNPVEGQPLDEDRSPVVWSGQTALELERHLKSRTRMWRIVLPIAAEGHNIPSISFCDDENGDAEKVVAFDIHGNTWILDIWQVGSYPVIYRPNSTPGVNHQRLGWGVLVLPDSSFRETSTASECLGLPVSEIIRNEVDRSGMIKHAEFGGWLDITCSLYYVRDLAPDPFVFLKNRHLAGPSYHKVHMNALQATIKSAAAQDQTSASEEDDLSDVVDSLSEEPKEINNEHYVVIGRAYFGLAPGDRWRAITKETPPADSVLTDLEDPVHLGRTIVPCLGQTFLLRNTGEILAFAGSSAVRKGNVRPIEFCRAPLPSHLNKNFAILRTTATDVQLQPFNRKGTGIMCRTVLTHHNHLGRRNEPWDLHSQISERISMLLHVPELNLVVLGSLNGRVALLTLTKTVRRVHGQPLRRGFRVDWVLPRKSEEEKRLRPLCTLHGIAMSPVPDPRARGLDLHGTRPRLPPVRYRLILHYLDHSILTYDIARRVDDGDLMIF
ncbi:hypothetical protein QBC47DRAFT_446896 [Echria macrotheca]|uniref:Uncharacterized protein n=1 Tax=Echria macrotheca TaxID=438768 RepID=A0AAJ0BDL8_9PEZI|nr:hypothetical protein QBC47DRAFT_446896 [Echria macrotheca]